jgi:hypothetical protein
MDEVRAKSKGQSESKSGVDASSLFQQTTANEFFPTERNVESVARERDGDGGAGEEACAGKW